ncbi:hypothetical protein [Streptomyces huiliensis]|uniref:hypothetical protein n=1 Tax=Streptomyces huiliensis TaxID=2876027 RepID=UPI001CBE3C6C|nr:hypothetical protein [Streptomyces huiliensis]MBZ4319450.1 hypothetical protein [Streptomyces huiliensis]
MTREKAGWKETRDRDATDELTGTADELFVPEEPGASADVPVYSPTMGKSSGNKDAQAKKNG